MNKKEIGRQTIHMTGGFIIVYLAYVIGSELTSYACLFISVLILLFSEYTRKKERIEKEIPLKIKIIKELENFALGIFNYFERRSEIKKNPYFGAFAFFLVSAISFLSFPIEIASIAILVLAVCDSVTTLAGIHYGKHKIFWNKKKSIEGSVSGFFSSIVACYIFSLFVQIPLTFILVAPLIGTVAESLPIPINDNIIIPIFVGIGLLVLL